MCLCSGISEVTTMYKFYFGLECSPVIVVLYYPLGQYGVVEAALYRPSPGNAPVKVAIKKTKVCLFMCAPACVCVLCMCLCVSTHVQQVWRDFLKNKLGRGKLRFSKL